MVVRKIKGGKGGNKTDRGRDLRQEVVGEVD